MAITRERPMPVLLPEYCKGCGRCIDSCTYHCFEDGIEIHQASGLVPIRFHPDACTACALCIDACPEPWGLTKALDDAPRRYPPALLRQTPIPDARIPLPIGQPLVMKGMYAAALGAILAGCRHYFGYPITPSTEGAELMAKLLPRLNGVFLQAVSEVAAINMMYGAGAAGLRATTFTSSPGFSLMLEGLSYMIGAQLPGVVVNVMRGGPGLGNIAPAQSDIKLACHGLGHGNTRAIVLAPSTPQEMLDLTMAAFDLSFTYRNPVIVLADGYVAQITGRVTLPSSMVHPGLPEWAVSGDAAHRRNVVSSIFLSERELEGLNLQLLEKLDRMADAEQRADLFLCDDADVVIVACNTPARSAKGAVGDLRAAGVRAGLFRPVTLWPFPIRALMPLLDRVRRLIVVEASAGQLEDQLRLAASHAGARLPRVEHLQRHGGVLPTRDDIVAHVSDQARARARGAAA